jgi:hypothetical protein
MRFGAGHQMTKQPTKLKSSPGVNTSDTPKDDQRVNLPDADSQLDEFARRVYERQKKAPNISIEMADGTAQLTIGENSELEDRLKLMAALGIYDLDFLYPLLSQIGNSVSKKNEMQESSMQFVIGFIKSIEPQNEI